MKTYDEELVKDRVNRFPFVKLMGMKLLSCSGGKSVIRCRVREVLKNSGGTLPGGGGGRSRSSKGRGERSRSRPIRTDTLVGDILREYPVLREKIAELFGPDCISCKSNHQETVTYPAWPKGLDPEAVVRTLNDALKGKQATKPQAPRF